VVLLAALLAALTATGCLPGPGTQVTISPPDPEPRLNIADSALGPGDTFEVRVFGEKDLSNIYRVGVDGSIDFPLIGNLKVVGMTPAEVAGAIAKKLQGPSPEQGFLKNPQVTVFVKELQSKKVFVFGQVNKPGTFNYEQNMSVVQAITLAGGFNGVAAKNDTTVTRLVQGKKLKTRVKVESIAEGSERNFTLKPGDIVFVPERFF
jgi:polysaccharide export outer membrane protein